LVYIYIDMIKNIKKEVQNIQVESMPPGYVKNPVSGKLIKVGGKQYNKLLQEGAVEHIEHVKPKVNKPNVVAEYKTNGQALQSKYKLQNDTPEPQGQIYAIGNDKKTLMLRKKKSKSMTVPDMTDLVSRAVARVHKKLEGYEQDNIEDNEETRQFFKQLIEQELVLLQSKPNNKPPPISESDSENDSELSD